MKRTKTGVKGVQPEKKEALTALNRKNSTVNGVEPKNSGVKCVEPGKKRH